MAYNTKRDLDLRVLMMEKKAMISDLKQKLKGLNYELMLLEKEQVRLNFDQIRDVARQGSEIQVEEIEEVLFGKRNPMRVREILNALGKAPTSVNRVAVMALLHTHTGTKFVRFPGDAYALERPLKMVANKGF